MWIEDKHIDERTLVIHIRSGDLFDGYCICPKTNKKVYCNLGLYPQPPFVFYKKIIDEHDYSTIHIVTEKDRRNPTIQMLVDEYDTKKEVIVQSGTFKEDANVILNAKHVIPSVGTFSFSLIMLSTKCEKMFFIKDHISPPRLDYEMNDERIRWYRLINYIPLGKWVLNKTNVQKLIDHSIHDVLPC
jgi:hypothetical protein